MRNLSAVPIGLDNDSHTKVQFGSNRSTLKIRVLKYSIFCNDLSQQTRFQTLRLKTTNQGKRHCNANRYSNLGGRDFRNITLGMTAIEKKMAT